MLCKPHNPCASLHEIQRTSWLQANLPRGIECANTLCGQLSAARLAGRAAQSVAREVRRALSSPLTMPPPELSKGWYDWDPSAAAVLLSGKWLLQIQRAAQQAGLLGVLLPGVRASAASKAAVWPAHCKPAPCRHSQSLRPAEKMCGPPSCPTPSASGCGHSRQGLQGVYDSENLGSGAAGHLQGTLQKSQSATQAVWCGIRKVLSPHRQSTPQELNLNRSCGSPTRSKGHRLDDDSGCDSPTISRAHRIDHSTLCGSATKSKSHRIDDGESCGSPARSKAHRLDENVASPVSLCSRNEATSDYEAALQCGSKRKLRDTSSEESRLEAFKAQRKKCSAC
jgi:hypothetical protein